MLLQKSTKPDKQFSFPVLGNPLQYSCLGNRMDRRAWRATVYGVEKESDTTEWPSNDLAVTAGKPHHHLIVKQFLNVISRGRWGVWYNSLFFSTRMMSFNVLILFQGEQKPVSDELFFFCMPTCHTPVFGSVCLRGATSPCRPLQRWALTFSVICFQNNSDLL